MSPLDLAFLVLNSFYLTQSLGLTFTYDKPLTDWWVESSTNLTNWQTVENPELIIWPDGTNCTLVVHPTKQQEYFRIAGVTTTP